MNRRDFLRTLGLGAAAAAVPRDLFAAKADTVKPNIILILTDDQAYADIHSHGCEKLDTPTKDRLADQGARFDRFYVSPVCSPTRASVLTGRYHERGGVCGVTRGLETMRADEVTIADVFKSAGYTTGCFGKWHNGAHWPCHPNARGFDEFLGFCAGHWNNYFDTTLQHNGRPVKTKGFIADVLTDAVLKFVEKNRSRPFFCYLPFNTPHTPFQVPDKYFNKYKARGFDNATATIYGMCENVDDNLARILAKLDELKLAADTIVMIFGDNGANTPRYNAGMRGRKGSVNEGGVRNFLFMRYPRRIKPGTVVKPICAHIDLLPTLVELAGVEMPKTQTLDGVSFVPLLEGRTGNWPQRMIFSHWKRKGAVRTQRWRFVLGRRNRGGLYDMTADPGETKNVAKEHPDVARKLKAAYDAWFKEVSKKGFERLPIEIGHEEWPLVELPAPECYLEGKVTWSGRAGWANDWITNWTDTDSYVYWDVDVVRDGTFEITLMYVCPKGDVGSKVRVEIGHQSVEGVIAKPHDPEPVAGHDRVRRKEVCEKTWAPLALGAVKLRKGRTKLAVKAITKPGRSVMDLKAVRVQRAD